MLSKPKSLRCTGTGCPGYGWVYPVPLGGSMTNAVLHIRLVGLHLETRAGQEESTQGVLLILGWRVGHLKVTGATFILIFWILLLKESGKKIWAAQMGFLLITPGMVWLCPSFSPSIPLLIEVPGPGPLLCLGETATCIWQLRSSVMTDSHPAKGQQQKQTSQPDKTAYAVAGKKRFYLPVFCSYYIPLAVLLRFQGKREREAWQGPMSSVWESKLQFLQRPK